MDQRRTINGNSVTEIDPSSESEYNLGEVKSDRIDYDPSASNLSINSSIDSGEFNCNSEPPITTKSTLNYQSKYDRKALIYTKLNSDDNGSESIKGSILSTGRNLLDKSAFSHRSIVNLYSEYKQSDEKTMYHKLSFFSIITASVLWVTCWAGVLFLPLTMIVLGAIYFDECPLIPELPPLLICMGIITTINNIVNVLDHIHNLYTSESDNQSRIIDSNGQSPSTPSTPISTIYSHLSTISFVLNLITTILTIYLAVIVFKHPTINSTIINATHSNSPTTVTIGDYCSPVIYGFASWIIYLIGLLCLFILIAIIFGCCYIIWKPNRNLT